MDQRVARGLAALSSGAGRCGRPSVGKLRDRVRAALIEPLERGTVALWLQLGADDCVVVESSTPQWAALFASAGVEIPCDFDAGADLGEAARQLRGKVIELRAAAA